MIARGVILKTILAPECRSVGKQTQVFLLFLECEPRIEEQRVVVTRISAAAVVIRAAPQESRKGGVLQREPRIDVRRPERIGLAKWRVIELNNYPVAIRISRGVRPQDGIGTAVTGEIAQVYLIRLYIRV